MTDIMTNIKSSIIHRVEFSPLIFKEVSKYFPKESIYKGCIIMKEDEYEEFTIIIGEINDLLILLQSSSIKETKFHHVHDLIGRLLLLSSGENHELYRYLISKYLLYNTEDDCQKKIIVSLIIHCNRNDPLMSHLKKLLNDFLQ